MQSEPGIVVFGSPVAVGHVRPLIPLARRLVARGLTVLWVISGDDNEPASTWRKPLSEIGVELVDLDETVRFTRGQSRELASTTIGAIFRRVTARANDVAPAAADVIRTAIASRPVSTTHCRASRTSRLRRRISRRWHVGSSRHVRAAAPCSSCRWAPS